MKNYCLFIIVLIALLAIIACKPDNEVKKEVEEILQDISVYQSENEIIFATDDDEKMIIQPSENRVTFINAQDEIVSILVDSNGLPHYAFTKEYILIYSNFTHTTVDIGFVGENSLITVQDVLLSDIFISYLQEINEMERGFFSTDDLPSMALSWGSAIVSGAICTAGVLGTIPSGGISLGISATACSSTLINISSMITELAAPESIVNDVLLATNANFGIMGCLSGNPFDCATALMDTLNIAISGYEQNEAEEAIKIEYIEKYLESVEDGVNIPDPPPDSDISHYSDPSGDLPGNPTGLFSIAVSTGQINLSWHDNSNDETGFKIERKTGESAYFNEIEQVDADTTSRQITGLSPSTVYSFRVRAFNEYGNSQYSNETSSATHSGLAPSFIKHSIDNTFNEAWSVFAIDLDHDLDMDILGAAHEDDEIAWWENDGNENFSKHIIDNITNAPAEVFGIDLDEDGDLDIITGYDYPEEFAWWENDGNENFSKHIILSDFGAVLSLQVNDIDKDNDLDIIAAAYNDYDFGWFENDGNEVFSFHLINHHDENLPGISCGYINDDNEIDIVVTSERGDELSWWENNGSESFTKHLVDSSFDGASYPELADLDQDNDLDIVCCAIYGDDLAWWENNGNGIFTKHLIDGNYNGAIDVHAADVDNDSDLDLYTVGFEADEVTLWLNDGMQSFTKYTVDSSYDGPYDVFIADIDNDGDIDVLAASNYGNEIAWWELEL